MKSLSNHHQLAPELHGEINSNDESPLCDGCKFVVEQLPVVDASKPILITTKDKIKEQAASGCLLCKFFLSNNNYSLSRDLDYYSYPFGNVYFPTINLGLGPVLLF
jgi:hypothetical protein